MQFFQALYFKGFSYIKNISKNLKKILEYVIIIVLYSTLLLEVFMAYFLRKEKKKKGTYLQMYESFWDKDKKQPRTKNVKSFGYVEDLISDEIPDPIKFYSDYVKKQNENRTKAISEESRPRAFPPLLNLI